MYKGREGVPLFGKLPPKKLFYDDFPCRSRPLAGNMGSTCEIGSLYWLVEKKENVKGRGTCGS